MLKIVSHAVFFLLDINECAASQCDLSSTECVNSLGGFHCRCKTGFAPTMECRPVGDLGLISGGISDDSITVSGSEIPFTKEVPTYIRQFPMRP